MRRKNGGKGNKWDRRDRGRMLGLVSYLWARRLNVCMFQ